MQHRHCRLYVVSTPIGNLGDISARALETLRSVDLICAEDTRHSRPLLAHFGIERPLQALLEHNDSETAESLETGRASCRESRCNYVYVPAVAASLTKKTASPLSTTITKHLL